jgi:glycosyltransferase EpsD
MKWFKEQGWVVDNISPGLEIADYVDNQYDVPITRNPLSLHNVLAYNTVKKIILHNHYDIVHCHTPVGGLLGRLCSIRLRKQGTAVIYTAHGFHFFKGSSMLSWIVYYPIEKVLSRYTDCIVTINQEDYRIAQNKFYARNVFKINGVGVNLHRFKPAHNEEKAALRKQYGFRDDDFIVIYVAQFVPRKNHAFLIRQAPALSLKIKNLKILFAGGGG